MTRESAISRATRHFEEGRFIEDLARRVAIRTESQVPESRPYMDVYLEQEIAPAFERMGFKVDILPNPVEGVGPILLAERIEDPDLPTVLSYGHGDVIRGLEGQWREGLSPWTLKQEGERYYGRGSADNKAQHSINMAALETVIAERGRLGFNAKFMLETGEELSSPGLRAFCEQHRERLKADVLIASDGPRLAAKRPTLYLGSRGAGNLNFTVGLREGAHHSGNWGGLLANPGIILAHALASIVTREGKVLVRELLPRHIPESVRAALRDCAPEPEEGEPAIDAWWGEPGLTAAERSTRGTRSRSSRSAPGIPTTLSTPFPARRLRRARSASLPEPIRAPSSRSCAVISTRTASAWLRSAWRARASCRPRGSTPIIRG